MPAGMILHFQRINQKENLESSLLYFGKNLEKKMCSVGKGVFRNLEKFAGKHLQIY